MTRLPRFGIVAAVAGLAVTVLGIGAYQAWWTIVFAIGGAAVFLAGLRGSGSGRSMAAGASIAGGLLLAGISVFFLYGSQFARARPCDGCVDQTGMWLAAAGGSIAGAIVLALFARRLLRRRATP